jgi:tetratricopeptide (TPR) repeat protein
MTLWRLQILALTAAWAIATTLYAEDVAPPDPHRLAAWAQGLDSPDPRVRAQAELGLFRAGVSSRDVLVRAAKSSSLHGRTSATRLLRLIRWNIHPSRPDIERLMTGYEARPFLGRLRLVFALERLADPDALAVLGRIAKLDVSARVRDYADRTAGRVLFRLGGGTETLLTALNAIGCRHLDKGEFEKAHARFDEMLRIMPGNATALYNKACTYARAKDVDLACAYLKKAVKNGFKDLEHIEGDSDLANIRNDPRYKKIVQGLK